MSLTSLCYIFLRKYVGFTHIFIADWYTAYVFWCCKTAKSVFSSSFKIFKQIRSLKMWKEQSILLKIFHFISGFMQILSWWRRWWKMCPEVANIFFIIQFLLSFLLFDWYIHWWLAYFIDVLKAWNLKIHIFKQF